MKLDRATLRLLGMRSPWPRMLELAGDARVAKQHRDRLRMAALRLSAVVRAAEKSYQKAYAATQSGRERRAAAKRRYREKLRQRGSQRP